MPETYAAANAPGALPLVGHAWPLLHRPIPFLSSLPQYGDLVEIRLGRVRAHVPCHPQLLRRVLSDDRTYDKGGPLFTRLRDLVGNGLGSCPHRDHRRQRRLLQPAFHRTRIETYTHVMTDEALRLSTTWQPGQIIDAFPAMFGLALRTVTRTLFSSRVGEDDVAHLQRSFETALAGLFRRIFVPAPLQRLPLPANRRYARALTDLHGSVDHLIADYLSTGENAAAGHHHQDRQDLLSTLIAARDDDTALSDGELHDQVLTMLLGGAETVAAALTWALYALTRNPRVAHDLHDEVDTVLAGRPPTHRDLPHLPRTHRMISETLRLYPPAWLFTRITTRPLNLAGRYLPSGTTLVISPPALHHNPALYPRATDFCPDRWADGERPGLPPRGEFTGFGAGARRCLGDTYALAEAALTLATLTQRWRMEHAPGTDIRPAPLSAVHRPRRLLLHLTPRTPAP
ncbi:cytochrome P450 [Streptomyces albireticuli]|uniref:cytochrome P450 n=1 Tax=Streptomyces albireticuli TaxID=1940 RepID=UPI001E31BC87|nr:cytochrome P450 [Streptomyces albireticuli]MCD9145675.1 cytochrome P450 [Streptomyces albireticuli]MCD9165593.1 cytochrome P450 [Streptomyces albireticuli]MCD9195884.1 cytochrome P450 [Streptomyces albireticuli]